MRWLLSLLLIIPTLAFGGTWYVYTGSPWLLQAASHSTYVTIAATYGEPEQATSADTQYQCSPALTHPLTIANSQVTIQGKLIANHAGSKSGYYLGLAWQSSGGTYTNLCYDAKAVSSSTDGLWTATCTPPATTIPAGGRFCIRASTPALAMGYDSATTQALYMTFTASCGSVGSAVCNGFCNGATCGTYSYTNDDLSACTASCTSCTTANVPVPTGLACVDQNTGSANYCSWNAASGASTYQLTRVGTGGYVYDGSNLNFTDYPNSGVYSYTIGAWGTCTPSIGGTSHNILGTASAPVEVQIRSKGVVSGCW